MSTNHYAAAENYLEEAAELVDTPRIGVARTLAVLAQAHATLALTKATRQPQVTITRTDVELSPSVAEALKARVGQ